MPGSLPHGLLLLPHTPHKHRLLTTGPCGSRPPTAHFRDRLWHPNSGVIDPDADAIALAWNREVLWPGCFRVQWTQVGRIAHLVEGVLKNDRGALEDLRYHLDSLGTLITVGVRRGELDRYRPLEVAL